LELCRKTLNSLKSDKTLDVRRSVWARNLVFPGQENSRIKRLQIIFRLHGVTSHPNNALRLLKSTLGSPCGAAIKRDVLFPVPLVSSFIHMSRSPKLRSSPATYGVKNTVSVHGAPRERKAYIYGVAAWFPTEIVSDTTIDYPTAMQPLA
jgi:hypothetical protein